MGQGLASLAGHLPQSSALPTPACLSPSDIPSALSSWGLLACSYPASPSGPILNATSSDRPPPTYRSTAAMFFHPVHRSFPSECPLHATGPSLSICSQLCPQHLAQCLVPNCHSRNNCEVNICQNFNYGPAKPEAFKRLFWKTAGHTETWASCISRPGQRSLVQGGTSDHESQTLIPSLPPMSLPKKWLL